VLKDFKRKNLVNESVNSNAIVLGLVFSILSFVSIIFVF